MAKVNPAYQRLSAGYLFPEIARRTREFQAAHPDAKILRLGIGDTTEALPPAAIEGMQTAVARQGNRDTYIGYGDSEGIMPLREAIRDLYLSWGAEVNVADVFVSDGAKSDSANIQSIFSTDAVVAVQDPAYPVYVDSNVMAGRSGLKNEQGQYEGLVYMPCTAENGFFPEIPTQKVDLIYICSPNNPTGTVATRKQLEGFVNYALENKAVIIFDSAYAAFIEDASLPRSIYEIPGARKCSIEVNSFSKTPGFTGVRLGWAIVPTDLEAEDAPAGLLHKMWTRRQNTYFNGASIIVQAGGLATLRPEGKKQTDELVAYYMENARIIRECLQGVGLSVYGGKNAPYVWMKTPEGIGSWAFFDKLLGECHVVGTPGAGFGPSGEGYFRLSAFGHRENILQATERIREQLKL
ncbi:MAG: LL-diaminopimelate aminotransferase [Kiritimatiellia bacterium]